MRKCPNCKEDLVIEWLVNPKALDSYLHEYCKKCGYDRAVDDFGMKFRERTKEFFYFPKKGEV